MHRWELAIFFAKTLVLPSLIYIALRSRHPARFRRRVAGFGCLWAGQLVIPMVGVAWLAITIGRDCFARDLRLIGILFGGGGAAVAGLAALNAVTAFHTGLSILRNKAPALVHRAALRTQARAGTHLLGTVLLLIMVFAIPLPGDWTSLVYLVAVGFSTGIAGVILMVIAGWARHTHSPAR